MFEWYLNHLQLRRNYLVLPFVFERFAVQTVAVKKNLIQCFLYLNSLQCKPLQLRKILFGIFFVLTINNQANVIYF